MIITEIVIHKSLLDKFKKDSLKYYPHEHIQAILGKQVGERLDVYTFYDLKVYKRIINKNETSIHYNAPEIEIEDSEYKYFGNIHSHPDGPLECSEWDKEEFYSVIISYDVSGERQSEVKNQLLKKGYVDTVTGDDGIVVKLPKSTLYKEKEGTVKIAFNDVVQAVAETNKDLKSDEPETNLERFIATKELPWCEYSI